MRRELAYAKLNLVLHVGHPREDGLHPLCSLLASIDLADELTAEPSGSGDRHRPVQGSAPATTSPRRRWPRSARAIDTDLPALALTIDKRIPVAAGLGGGSADAAAALRIANELAGAPLARDELMALAAGLGSDVPSQLVPGHAIVQGVGERVEPTRLPAFTAVLVPDADGLSTGAVYAELDRLDGTRDRLDPEPLRELASAEPADLAAALDNDLQPAALSLRPGLGSKLDALNAAGALGVAVSGSGPTCFGLFADRQAAEDAAARLDGAIVTTLR